MPKLKDRLNFCFSIASVLLSPLNIFVVNHVARPGLVL